MRDVATIGTLATTGTSTLPQRLPPALTTKSNFQSLVLLTPFEFAVNFRLFYPTVHQSNEVFHSSGVLSLSLRRKSPVRCNWSTLNANLRYLRYLDQNIVRRHPVYCKPSDASFNIHYFTRHWHRKRRLSWPVGHWENDELYHAV